MVSLSERFASCTIVPIVSDDLPSSSLAYSDGKWKISSFYLDSSKRASIFLPLKLQCPCKDVLDELLANKTVFPWPGNVPEKDDTEKSREYSPSLSLEAKVTLTFGTGEAITATIEGVSILSTTVEESCLFLFTEITIRVSRSSGDKIKPEDASGVKTNVEITAILAERYSDTPFEPMNLIKDHQFGSNILDDSTVIRRMRQTKLPSFVLHVILTHALSVSVKSVTGTESGQTFLSLTIRHSNTHSQTVTIRNIALHPGHSRRLVGSSSESPDMSSQLLDLSKTVKWGYAPTCEPPRYLVLKPHEAFATALLVSSFCEFQGWCTSPLTVTATVGQGETSRSFLSVIAVADAKFICSRTTAEPSDAFCVEIRNVNKECTVGEPLTVVLDIRNLSCDARNLRLCVTGYEESVEELKMSSKLNLKISGLLGASSDHTHHPGERDWERNLLAMDVSLPLGELAEFCSTKAELRFVPLLPGTHVLPSLVLIDVESGARYNCDHRFSIVAGVSR